MRSVLMFASAVCLVVLPVSAQEWRTEQRELIDHVQRCWRPGRRALTGGKKDVRTLRTVSGGHR